ncbi:MAG: hypothetical protein KJ949_03135 [Nanoarchaeota archaeon]|nr:hypothetical protein [Nanoarchaeota archaeon]
MPKINVSFGCAKSEVYLIAQEIYDLLHDRCGLDPISTETIYDSQFGSAESNFNFQDLAEIPERSKLALILRGSSGNSSIRNIKIL